MGRRAKNKQGPPEPLIPVKDATNKPIKPPKSSVQKKSGLTETNGTNGTKKAKRKAEEHIELEIESKKLVKKPKQEIKSSIKRVASKKAAMPQPKNTKPLQDSFETDEEDEDIHEDAEVDGWEDVSDEEEDLESAKKYVIS